MVDMVHPGSRDQDTEADRLARESAAAFRVAEATPDVGDKAAALREARKLAGDSALAAAYIYLQRSSASSPCRCRPRWRSATCCSTGSS